MKTNRKINTIAVVVLTGLMAMGTYAFADKGKDRGAGKRWDRQGYGCAEVGGPGAGRQGYGMGRRGFGRQLSEEDHQALETEREAFFENTKDLRQKMRETGAAMEAEMVKKTPNKETVMSIQQDISKLKAEMDAKSVEHRLKMREKYPDLETGFGRHMRGGFGGGHRWGDGHHWGGGRGFQPSDDE